MRGCISRGNREVLRLSAFEDTQTVSGSHQTHAEDGRAEEVRHPYSTDDAPNTVGIPTAEVAEGRRGGPGELAPSVTCPGHRAGRMARQARSSGYVESRAVGAVWRYHLRWEPDAGKPHSVEGVVGNGHPLLRFPAQPQGGLMARCLRRFRRVTRCAWWRLMVCG